MASIDELWDLGSDINTIELYDDGISTNEIVDNENLFDFEIGVTDDDIGLPEQHIVTDWTDKLVTKTYTSHIRQHKQCSINKLCGKQGIGRPIWTNADVNGYVLHRTNGNLAVSAKIKNKTRTSTLSLTGIPDPTYSNVRGIGGWVYKEIADTIDNRILTGGDKTIYSTKDHVTPNYIRNTNCWGYGLNLTPISPWNSYGGDNRAGILVTPCHIIMAYHYMITIGSTIRFVTLDNTIITRTLTDRYYDTNALSDIAIGKLDSDIPDSLTFAKCLPTNYIDYFVEPYWWIPLFKTDKEEKLLCAEIDVDNDIYHDAETGDFLYTFESDYWMAGEPEMNNREDYYEIWIGGDSASPAFMVINGDVVLISCAYSGRIGPAIVKYYDAINDGLTALGGGYQLTPIDLSSFRSVS